MPSMNPFASNPAFSMASLTAAINVLPNQYGRINQLNLMPSRGVTTRAIMCEEKNGVLTLLPTRPVGAPASVGTQGKRKLRSFVIPHIPHEDTVDPSEVQDVRAFGSEDTGAVLVTTVNDKLATMRNKHAITLEHLRMGALKGQILDADGSMVYNLFTEFGISQSTVAFVLGTAGTNVRGKCTSVLRLIEDNLLGEVMTGVHCLCSPGFYDALTAHPKVEEAFKYYQTMLNQNLAGDYRQAFSFGGIVFEEYRGQASDASGTVRKFIPDNEAIAFPLGTMQTFETVFAPADFNETVNTVGMPYYAKIEEKKFGRGYELHTQSNPLPMCYRPALLIRLTVA
jgi:hypothetical protein